MVSDGRGKKRNLGEDIDEDFDAEEKLPGEALRNLLKDAGDWIHSHYGKEVKRSPFVIWTQSEEMEKAVEKWVKANYTKQMFIDFVLDVRLQCSLFGFFPKKFVGFVALYIISHSGDSSVIEPLGKGLKRMNLATLKDEEVEGWKYYDKQEAGLKNAYRMVLMYTSRFLSFRKFCSENDIDVMITKPLLEREIGLPQNFLKDLPHAFVLAIFKETRFLKARLDELAANGGSVKSKKKKIAEKLVPRVRECLKDCKFEGSKYRACSTLCRDLISKLESEYLAKQAKEELVDF